MDMDYQALGRRIRIQRKLMNMRQDELAMKAGISTSFVGHIERGEKKFSIETLVSICNTLNVSPNQVLQDSLDVSILNRDVDVGTRNKALFDDMMQLLHEHKLLELESEAYD